MGAGASMEEEQAQSRGNSGRIVHQPTRQRPRSNISRTSSRGRSGSWKELVRNASFKQKDSRKLRAAALGRKTACVVLVDKTGFSPQHIQICEGQAITFEWDASQEGGHGFNVTQVIHDGDSYKTVVGGYNSGPLSKRGYFEQQFNLTGEFKFVSAGLKTTPLTLEVWPRKDVEWEITDNGFTPKLVRVDEGNTVHWTWAACSIPHTIQEAKFSLKQGTLIQQRSERAIATKAGNFRREFTKPGMYYYQTETLSQTELSTCIVHVRERQREYRIDVQDSAFSPPIVVIQQGDRIWWEWKKDKCAKAHCIYQIQPPPVNFPSDESFKPLKNGFKWPQPTKSGLMSHEFLEAGVYYFSDYCRQEAAEYIGTVIVKPKQEEHYIEITPEGFVPDIIYASTGDRLWWTWANDEVDHTFNIIETEKCLSSVGGRPAIETEPQGDSTYTDQELEHWKVASGLETVQLGNIGVYHYRVSDSPHNISTCSLIVQGGPRNHTIHVTDHGFEPKVVTIHPGDRIWWVWQEGNKQHNIIQVSHQGQHINTGFCSGAAIDCPSAFMHQFTHTGVYYYISDALPKSFGAVVVASYPRVHEIQITANSIVPDPCAVNLNDVVAWTFRSLRQNDVHQADTVDKLIDAQFQSFNVPPRRVMNRVFADRGTFHFASKSFFKQTTKGKKERPSEETALDRISSVLVDELSDSSVVRVDSKGFHPNQLTIRKGQSVLWSWKDSGEETHNIVHVNPPNSDAPLSVIQGGKSFNSGKPMSDNSFLYTFDDLGDYAVASQGAPGHDCRVHVIDGGRRTGAPYIVSGNDGGTVSKFHTVHIKCDTPNAKIYYTTDGSVPELHKLSSKGTPLQVYDKEKGIILKNSGLAFVRAIAVSQGNLNSDVMTSRRYWVLTGEEGGETSDNEEEPVDEEKKNAMWHWWRCIPTIKAVITQPGIMEVFWEHPPADSHKYIRGYNIFLHGVTYCEMFPPSYNAITVAGLAGDRMYETYLEVYPHDHTYLPHKSNKLIMKMPKTTNTGGPLISLEVTKKEDSLAIIWMNVASQQDPVDSYIMYLNGQMCGDRVKPDENSDRCKVVIEGCQLDFLYKVVVTAVPKDGSTPRMSNELEVQLPLEIEDITLPVKEARMEDDDLYKEYIEVRENTGDIRPDQTPPRVTPKSSHTLETRSRPPPQRSPSPPRSPTSTPRSRPKSRPRSRDRSPSPPTSSVLSTGYIALPRDPKEKKEEKKSKRASAVVVVQDTAHVNLVQKEHVHEVQATPTLGVHDSEAQLPQPIVTAANMGKDSVRVTWHFKRSAEPLYRLMVNVVNIVGPKFASNINSNISFDCMHETKEGGTEQAVQHQWTITHGNSIDIAGLSPGLDYQIQVVATYALANAQQPYEIQAKSEPITYTTLGPPKAPGLKAVSTDLYMVTLGWEPGHMHRDVVLSGYNVLVDGNQLGGVLAPTIRQTVIDNLQPGKTIKVAVQTITDRSIGNSELSNVIRVTCPTKPPPPAISHQPSYKKGSVMVAWERPVGFEHATYGEDISFYRIYLDTKWHGEVKACAHCNRNGYQYLLTDLNPGQSYDVTVKAFAGQRKVDPTSDTVFSVCESDMSNSLSVMCPAPPTSPVLRLEGMDASGIDVTWTIPQQYGDAQISGYQMMKNSKLYGSIIPPDVHSLRIHGLSLGERVELQILALTDHPVGRDEKDKKDQDSNVPSEIYVGDKYSACKPGPKLTVVYTGLVQAPSKIWCEQVTGHSATIVWQTERKPKPHYVHADSYQVTWWPGDKPEQDINSQQTKEDHLLVTGLKPHTKYSVVVEARKMQKYQEVDSHYTDDNAYSNTFILTAQTEKVTLKTASPPNAPSNIGIVSTTCSSIQVGWDSPKERGAEVIGMRIDAVATKPTEHNKHACVEAMPDATTAVINSLSERSEYLITVTAVTEEYFDQLPPGHELRRSRQLTKHKTPPEDTWLPSTSIMASTSGTIPPTNLRVVKTTVNCVTLTWKPATVFGSNRLQGHIVRWAEGQFTKSSNKDETELAHHKSVQADSNKITLEGLHPGILYKMVVEAVVSVKTTLESKIRDPEYEKLNRRTTHVMSKPVFVRTRAPCERPKLIVSGYTQNTIQLYWERPLLYSIIGKDSSGNPQYLKLALENYRLEINGKPHMRLLASAQSCTLIKCKPGKKYKIELVASTCTEEVKKERKRRGKGSKLDQSLNESTLSSNKEWEVTAEDLENDESRSKAIEVTLPRSHEGLLKEALATYIPAIETSNNNKGEEHEDLGDVKLDWSPQGEPAFVRQFNLVWHCHADGSVQKKVVGPEVRSCSIPVQHRKCLYDMTIETEYTKEVIAADNQSVQCIIPGSPDAPEIWTRSVANNEFVIEWGEPRLYAVKIRGYQVYMNERKVGNTLHSHHRKAVIPCKPRRQYKVTLVALSSDTSYNDSAQSNTLLIHTGGTAIEASSIHVTEQIANQIRAYEGDSDDLPVRVAKVTESSIHLDWSNYTEIDGMTHYKILWSSVAQPAEREVRLPAGERSCVIHKCFTGANHFIRIYACGDDERILDKSSQIQAQTSASPSTPNVSIRACNFKYIAIQWEEPTMYGDAKITGYKVFVNGVVEAILGPDQHSYSFTHGKWCKEYIFQVQALTNHDDLNSKPSDPLVVTWPGVQAPVLNKAPSVTGNCIRIKWISPDVTDGVKIKQFKLVCLDEESERVAQIISPIHPDATEAELQNLKHGNYLVYVEVHVHGTNDVVKSDVIKIAPSILPDAPHITVTVIGIEERRQIEKVTCDLINRRDKLVSVISNHAERGLSPKRVNDGDHVLNKAAESLAQTEEMLDDCLSSLNHYTGHLLAHVGWTCAQSNPDVRVSGYKVLVDGKQYGTTLHAGVKNVRIKLGLNQSSHRLSMVSVCDRPQTTSVESNVVELLTEPFLPFAFYSFLTQDPKNSRTAGPSYQEALAIERKKMGKKPISQGVIKRKVPPPACTLLDIFQGAYYPLFPPSGPTSPTAVLFWAKWCYSSRKTLEWFVKYAKNHSSQYEFVAIACTPPNMGPSDKQDLVQCIQQNGWREDTCIRHLTSHSANEITLRPYDNCKWNHKDEEIRSTDMTEIFGVVGVPTILIVHPEDYVAWKGRYCAFDYDQYEHFLNYVFAQSMQKPILPEPDPWEKNVNSDGLGSAKGSIHRPMSATLHRQGSGSHSLTIHMNGSTRPQSGKRLFTKSNKRQPDEKKLSVDMRPYSASASPYIQKLTSPGTKRKGSARKAKSTF